MSAPHKHAESMLEYAQDAAKTSEPWKLWESKHNDNDWETLGSNPTWLKSFEYRRKPVKWEPVGGEFFIKVNGDVWESPLGSAAREFGHERPTEEQAKRAAVEMRRFNRLLALRDELCGDEVPNWNSERTEKWKLLFSNVDNKWFIGKNQYRQDVNVYFTTEEHAQRACDMLNSGEVEL